MKISCDIIRDILPLYAENMTSAASNEMVEEHLGECEGCTNYLKELRTPARMPEQIPVENLKHIKKEIGKRRILSVLMAVFLVLSLISGIHSFLDAEIILSAEEAVDYIEPLENGIVRVHWKHMSRGYASNKYDGDIGNWGILTTQRRSELMFQKRAATRENIEESPESYYTDYGKSDKISSPEDNYWYINIKDGTGEMLLREGGTELPPEGYVFSRGLSYGMVWTCIGLAVLTAVSALISWMFRGRRAGKWVRYFSLFFGSVLISLLFASGGQFVSHHGEFEVKFEDSWLAFIPMFLTGYFAFELWDLSHPLPALECTPEKRARDVKNKCRVLKVITAILLTASLVTGISFFLYSQVYLTAEEAVLGVEELENGEVAFKFCSTGNTGVHRDDAKGEIHSGCTKNVLAHRLFGKSQGLRLVTSYWTMPKEKLNEEPSYWYLNPRDGTADVLLWDSGSPKPEGPLMEKNYDLGWYCVTTAACAVLLWLLARYLPTLEKYLQYGAMISGSLCISMIFVSGCEFYKFSDSMLWYRAATGLYIAVPLFLAGLCIRKLRDLKKQDTP